MSKKVILLFLLSLCLNLKAQTWTPLDTGLQNYIPYGLLADNVNGNLIAFGNTPGYNGVNVWRNNIWEVLYQNIEWGTYGNEVAILNNKVVFFKRYYENNNNSKPRTAILEFSDSTNIDTLKLLQNQDWLPTGSSTHCIYNNKLILFTNKFGVKGLNCIATFDGDTIIPIGDVFIDSFHAACEYKGDLYAAGQATNSARGLFKKTPTGWQLIYQIQGTTAFINGMTVYKNRMYIYGELSTLESPSNLGNNILAYDGTTFDTLGGGVINEYDITDGKIYDVAISGNRLYVTGNFSKAGGTKSRCVSYWNDSTWCSITKDLDSTYNFFRIESFQDTIYQVADFRSVNNDTTFGWIGKLYDKNYSDTCSESFFVSVKELSQVSNFKIYPNPTSSILNIIDEQNQLGNSTISISNYLGQTILSVPFSNQIDISNLASGMYFLTVQDKDMKRTVKIIKE